MPQIKFPQAQHCELPNGFRYIYYPDHDNKIICLQLIVKIGSAFETDQERGFSHLLEHLSFKSTEAFPNNELSDYLSSKGISVNAYTDFDSTCYYMLLPSERLSLAVKALAELGRNSLVNSHDLKAEKQIVLEEIRQYDTDPESSFTDFIQNDYFVSSPLAHPIIGTVPGIKAIQLEQVEKFQSKYYNPGNCFLVVCGSLNPDDLHNAMKQNFADWTTSPVSRVNNIPREAELNPEYNGFKVVKAPINTDLEYIAVALPELSELHPDSEHLLFAMRYLAIGKSSLLHKRLIEKEKLCSSVRVLSVSGLMSGISVILISPLANADYGRIIEIFREEYHKVLSFRISTADFELIRSDIIHSWLFGFDTMEGLASGLAAEELLGSYQNLYLYRARIDAITPDEIAQKTSSLWKPASLAIYYLGTNKEHWYFLKSLSQQYFSAPESLRLKSKQRQSKRTNMPAEESVPVPSQKAYKLQLLDLDEPEIYHFMLDNGLKVIFKRSHGRPLTGFAFSSQLSQLMEDSSNRGANLFTTTAMLYGTKRRSHDQIMNLSRYLGMNLRVVHHLDCSSFRGKCFNPDFPKAMELLSELIREPSFKQSYLNTLKHSTIDGIRRDREVPSTYAFNRWFKLVIGNHTNLDRSSGNITQIKRINRDILVDWHKQILSPESAALAIVGDYEPAELSSMVASAFDALESSTVEKRSPLPYFDPAKQHTLIEKKSSEQAILHLGVLLPYKQEALHDTAMQLICHAIGGDIASRFYNILREKHSYTYQAGMDFNSVTDLGFWTAYAYCAPQDYREVYALMREIIQDVQENGLSDNELEQSRSYLLGMQRFDYESLSWSASAISNLSALNYPPDYFFRREQRLKDITPELLRRVAAKWLQAKNIYSYILA